MNNYDNLDQIFKTKLANQEAEPSASMSFDSMMAMRAASSQKSLLKPILWGIGSLAFIGISTFLWLNKSNTNAVANNNAAQKTISVSQNTNNNSTSKNNNSNNDLNNTITNSNYNSNPTNSELSSNQSINNTLASNNSNNLQSYKIESSKTEVVAAKNLGNSDKNATGEKSDLAGNNDIQAKSNTNSQHKITVANTTVDSKNFAEYTLNARYLNVAKLFNVNLDQVQLAQMNPNTVKVANLKIEPDNDNIAKHFTLELMMATGRIENSELNVLGGTVKQTIHSLGFYQGKVLFDINQIHRLQLGVGLGFGQNTGSGTLQNSKVVNQMVIDTQVVVIIQPGLPNSYETVYDTSYKAVTLKNESKLSYTQSRINVPLSANYLLGSGPVSFRLSGTVAPGLLIQQKGSLFAENNTILNTQTSTKLTVDARLGFGILLNLNNNTKFIVEPGVQYSTEGGQGAYKRFIPGLGIGLSFKY